jgi:polysaccharide biosynthesis/export protein
MRRLVLLATTGSLLLAVPSVRAEAQAASAPRPASAVTLRPGDAVRISVWRRPDLSGEFQLAADGSVADPFYLGLQVANMSLDAVEERVRNYVAQYQESPRVLVQPLVRVGVGGEVRQPSLYLMRPDFTIMQAVMQAGGPTEQANMGQVELFRDGRRTSIDLSDPGQLSQQSVHSGDQILVKRRGNFLRDVVGPSAGVLGAIASIVLVAQRRR